MPVTLPQLTGLMGTFTVSMVGVCLLDLLAPAPAMVVLLALLVQTVLPVQQGSVAHLLTTALLVPAKPLLRLLTTGLTVTSTASMGEKLVGLQAPAPALLATQITTEQVVKQHLVEQVVKYTWTWMESLTQSVTVVVVAAPLATQSCLMGTR